MMYLDAAPRLIETTVFSAMPDQFRRKGVRSECSAANRLAQPTDCFIEGPSFDASGHLYIVDIPFGRIFRIAPDGTWSLVVEYDGWPNGLKIHPDGRVLVADYRHGLMALDVGAVRMQKLLTARNSESSRAATICISRAMATSILPTRARPACTIRPGGFIDWVRTGGSTA